MKLINFTVGPDQPLFLIAGPCVVESEGLILDTAGKLKELTARLGIPYIFKSSFDKANRSSQKSFRGPGMEEGLRILSEVKRQLGLPVLVIVLYLIWTGSGLHQHAIQQLVMPVTTKGWLLILPYVLVLPVLLFRDRVELWLLRRRVAKKSQNESA